MLTKLPNGVYIRPADVRSIEVEGEAVPATIDGSMRCWWARIQCGDRATAVRFEVKEDADMFADGLARLVADAASEEMAIEVRIKGRRKDRMAVILAGLLSSRRDESMRIDEMVGVAHRAAVAIDDFES